MKVLQINSICGQGSTGRICTGIADSLKNSGDIPYIAYSLGYSTYPNSIKICHNPIDYSIHNILSKISDSEGLHSISPTRFLINQIHSIQPDIIHLHTLHGHYINYKLLLEYINKTDVPVVLTLHDCWNFTGHCAHFDMYDCNKWKTECIECKYIYNPKFGNEKAGIPAGTPFEDLPDDWVCPVCGEGKDMFEIHQ